MQSSPERQVNQESEESPGHMVSKLIDSMEIDHLLNYGNGGGVELAAALTPERDFRYQVFDANVPELAGDPIPAEMVVCIDSLSQIAPFQVDTVLDKLEKLTEQVLFLTIDTERMSLEWWLPRIMERFAIQLLQVTGPNRSCIVAYRPDWFYAH